MFISMSLWKKDYTNSGIWSELVTCGIFLEAMNLLMKTSTLQNEFNIWITFLNNREVPYLIKYVLHSVLMALRSRIKPRIFRISVKLHRKSCQIIGIHNFDSHLTLPFPSNNTMQSYRKSILDGFVPKLHNVYFQMYSKCFSHSLFYLKSNDFMWGVDFKIVKYVPYPLWTWNALSS